MVFLQFYYFGKYFIQQAYEIDERLIINGLKVSIVLFIANKRYIIAHKPSIHCYIVIMFNYHDTLRMALRIGFTNDRTIAITVISELDVSYVLCI